jgi:hypothetical protein
MALTELQLLSKAELYRNLQNAASEMYQSLERWKMISDFIGTMDTSDMDTIGVGTGQVRTDLANFRTVVNYFLSLYNNNPVTPTVSPITAIDRVRRMW